MSKKSNLSFSVVFLLLTFTFLLASCQQRENEENFQILIFSNTSEVSLKDILARAETETNLPVDIKIYPPVVERLIIEIVQNSGDLLIMDRDLLAAAYDSKELYQLDEFRNSENTIELTEFEIEALKAAGEKAEKGDIYLNALRVNHLEETDSEPRELVAIIPKYIKNKEAAFLILEKIAQK